MADRSSETEDVTVAFEEETLAALNRKARRDHGGYRGAAVSALLEEWVTERAAEDPDRGSDDRA